MKRVSARYIDKLADNEIFVFGSNTQGAHGGGAAKMAMNFGAIYGKPFGLQGKTFAIPTVDYTKNGKMSIESIKEYVNKFLEFTKENKDKKFVVYISGITEQIEGLYKETDNSFVLIRMFDI